jgi:hypothetical protein
MVRNAGGQEKWREKRIYAPHRRSYLTTETLDANVPGTTD